jgi:hypothetical protein
MDELKDHVVKVSLRTNVKQGHEVWVGEAANYLCFLVKKLHQPVVPGPTRVEQLHGNIIAGPLILS